MMANDDENWESKVDWTRFNPPCGGRAFYDFLKGALPRLDEGIAQLRADYARETERLARWNGIARLADRLRADFAALSDSPDFARMLGEIDGKMTSVFTAGEFPTIGSWLRWGEHITRALGDGSAVPDGWRQAKVRAEHDLATAETLRRFIALYLATSEKDFLLRYAPIRLRTRLFRDIARDVAALVAAGEALEREDKSESFIAAFWTKTASLLDVARRTHRACRQMRKSLERMGERYWRETADLKLLAAAM